MGLRISGPIGFWWDLLGIITGVIGMYSLYDAFRGAWIDRNPDKGYIDHLADLKETRENLNEKISELTNLLERQKDIHSDRAENRRHLVEAALANRLLKLDLITETEFIIESRKKISRIEALARDLEDGINLKQTEKEIDRAFADIKQWMKNAPDQCRSSAGKKTRESLEEVFAFRGEIVEQLEDRMVMRALNDENENETDEAFTLEKVHRFIEKSALDTELDGLDMKESIAADEEYIRINTELRLIRDGIKHDFASETEIELETLDETALN